MRIKTLFIILILSLVLLPTTPALAQEVTAEDIADQLMCQCGCGLILGEGCNCPLPKGAVEMKALISEQLAQGKSQQEILNFFFARYGAQVLVTPKQDSNLVLWIAALIGISAIGAVIYFTQKKRARGNRDEN